MDTLIAVQKSTLQKVQSFIPCENEGDDAMITLILIALGIVLIMLTAPIWFLIIRMIFGVIASLSVLLFVGLAIAGVALS